MLGRQSSRILRKANRKDGRCMSYLISGKRTVAFVLFSIVILSAFTIYVQYRSVGLSYLEEGPQKSRHLRVMQDKAPSPWQYRVLPDYLVDPVIRGLSALAVPHPLATGFLGFRMVQNLLLFLAAYLYYRALGLQPGPTLIGMSMLAWGMTNALYDSDLQFSTYFDIAAYLLAGFVIARNKFIWIIPITAIAALNRETSGLIPFILLAACLSDRPDKKDLYRVLLISGISLAIYTAIYFGLRLWLGPQPTALAYGIHQGLPIFKYNIRRPITYFQVLATLGIIPFMALLMYGNWLRRLKAFFWTLVPVWFVVHAFAGVLAESRLMLVPQALVFIPAALVAICGVKESARDTLK
jgi:hypothetical protein